MDFVAIDVETANEDFASICQVGVATYRAGELVDEFSTLVDPQDWFSAINISIHGITEDDVRGAPTFVEIADGLGARLADAIAVCHTHFDRVSLAQAFHRHERQAPACAWLDTARVARRCWPDRFAERGYGLVPVCQFIGHGFKHHDALNDAKASAAILLAAAQHAGFGLDAWMDRIRRPIRLDVPLTEAREGHEGGPLSGEEIVFTGALSMTRREAADMADRLGASVGTGVTRHTTILVVGDQDVRKLAGHERSSKHRKAEDLIAKGQPIRVVRETDFIRLVDLAEASAA